MRTRAHTHKTSKNNTEEMADSPDYSLSPPLMIDQQAGSHYNNLNMLYTGFFVIATAGLILAIYHCLALNWCSDYPPSWPRIAESIATHQSFTAQKVTKLDSMLFKYKKHQEEEDEECVVCLSEFEEGEDVRKLVRCKHSFHAPCIDMWLFSHFDCPLCRAPVGGALDGGSASLSQNSGLNFPDADSSPV